MSPLCGYETVRRNGKTPAVRHISREITNKKIKEPQSGDTKI